MSLGHQVAKELPQSFVCCAVNTTKSVTPTMHSNVDLKQNRRRTTVDTLILSHFDTTAGGSPSTP